MTREEFSDLYWYQYIMIEKEFKATTKYVTIDSLNCKAYSIAYAKLLLQIGSEVDVIAKQLCLEINNNSKAKNINQYSPEIIGRFIEFPNVTVACGSIVLQPWKEWDKDSPDWWKVYNGVKHNRNKTETYANITQENYRFGNQENTLNALAGLYQLEQYLYSVIAHNPHEETPLPGSRLFKLIDCGWEKKQFAQDMVLYVNDDGMLYSLTSDSSYADL